MNKYLVLCFLTFTLFSVSAIGQDFPMLHFGVDEGLPSDRVYEVYRDSKGFIWIATDKGVARYNGIKFQCFTTFDGLADNDIFFIQEDKQGRIWMSTGNGELCFYKDGVFHNSRNTPFLKLPFKAFFISIINVEYDGSVTIGFSEQPYIVNIHNDMCKIFNLDNEYNVSYANKNRINQLEYNSKRFYKYFFSDILSAHKMKDGTYMISCARKRFTVNSEGKILKVNSIFQEVTTDFGQNMRYMYNGQYILSADMDTIKRLNSTIYEKFYALHQIYRFYINENFFVATAYGLYVNDTLVLLRNKPVSSITQDNTGKYWMSTLKSGIYCMDQDYTRTRIYNNGSPATIKYSSFIKDHLFFANANNSLYTITGGVIRCLFDYSKKYKYVTNALNTLIIPNEPGFFIDTNYDYYFFYHYNNGIIKNVLDKNYKINSYHVAVLIDNIKAIYKNTDNLYVHDRWRLVKINYRNKRRGDTIDGKLPNINLAANNMRIFGSAESMDGSIWYSSRDNVYKVVNDSSIVQHQFNTTSFEKFVITGRCLVGYTHDNKLCICNNFENSISIDSVVDQNCIWDKLYKIDSTHILLSTNDRYRILTLASSKDKPRFSVGVVENSIVPLRAESITSDGINCYFFKNGSVTSLALNILLRKHEAPRLFFSFLKVNGKNISVNAEYTVPYNMARNLALSYSTISFGSKDVSYQYSVSKNDKDNWGSITGEEINLINSNYGDYTIKVRAKTLSSDYSEPIVFTLHIQKPFWATWWFISLSVLVFGGIVALIVWQRIKAVVSKREKAHDDKVRFMRSEYKALNALMNPHFIFNTLNNVQSLVNGNNKLAANEYLRIFSDLVRQNMHNVSKELIPLQKEIDLVTNYLLLEKLRFEDKLNYEIEIDQDLELYDIMVSPLLIQPLVENSIKHGILPLKDRVGIIKISIEEKNSVLYIKIRDNGVGLNNALASEGSLHESYGLSNIKKRIEQLSIIQGKEMTFNMGEETNGGGVRWTTVIITMPL